MNEQIHFHVSPEQLENVELGDLIDIEEKPTIKAMVSLLANFVQNGDGVYLPKGDAYKLLRNMKVGQLKAATDGVMGKIKDIVPNM
jgi:hypothetical protein